MIISFLLQPPWHWTAWLWSYGPEAGPGAMGGREEQEGAREQVVSSLQEKNQLLNHTGPEQNENVGPLAEKVVRISTWWLEGINQAWDPSQSGTVHIPVKLVPPRSEFSGLHTQVSLGSTQSIRLPRRRPAELSPCFSSQLQNPSLGNGRLVSHQAPFTGFLLSPYG